MAGLIQALFGGRSRPPDPDPLPGQGGYQMPAGRAGQTGFSGSTSSTRTFRGGSPRVAKLRKDELGGWESGLSDTEQVRQASYRGDQPTRSPRKTPRVATAQPVITEQMQATPATFYGGPELCTGPGNQTAGGHPLSGAAAAGGHSERDTTTPWRNAQPEIGVGTPGAENVRNQIAERYRNPPGQLHAYRSAPRADQPGVTEVVVPNRFVFDGGGNQTWSVLRDMPYGRKGNGKRGASLNGDRYYGTGGYDQFGNAGRGSYGLARLQGPNHRPTFYQEPAPWSTNYYDTTQSVGTADAPGPVSQAPDMVYVSPDPGRSTKPMRG